jgi:Uma2 family endonuclease
LDVAPELIVEILSPDDRWSEVKQKLKEYFAIGVQLVWVADPADKTIYAYRSLTDVREFTEKDTLTGDEVLPGFSVLVADLFEE